MGSSLQGPDSCFFQVFPDQLDYGLILHCHFLGQKALDVCASLLYAVSGHCCSCWCDHRDCKAGIFHLCEFPRVFSSCPSPLSPQHIDHTPSIATQIRSCLSKPPLASQVPFWIEILNGQSCQEVLKSTRVGFHQTLGALAGLCTLQQGRPKSESFSNSNKCPTGQTKQVQPKVNLKLITFDFHWIQPMLLTSLKKFLSQSENKDF